MINLLPFILVLDEWALENRG